MNMVFFVQYQNYENFIKKNSMDALTNQQPYDQFQEDAFIAWCKL